MNKKIKCVIFDLDGTLIDSGPDLLDSLNYVEKKDFSENINLGKIDLGIIDTQGFELEVLKGLEEEIYNFKYLVVEFNVFEGYIGQVVFSDLDNYLSNKSFTRIKTVRKINQKNYNDVNYGDAIYINNKLIGNLRVNYQKISNKFFDSFLYRMILILRDIPFHKKQIKKIIKRS